MSNILLVLVKGSAGEAARAAADRGIPAAHMRTVAQTFNGTRWDETTLQIGTQWHDAVARWFTEPSESVPGVGYPSGTVLYYSTGPVAGRSA